MELAKKAARILARKGPRSAVYRPGNRALREIRKYQGSTKLLLKKTPFTKSVKNVFKVLRAEEGTSVTELREKAVEALQEAAEDLMLGLFMDMVLLMEHANRKTVQLKNLNLAVRVHGYHRGVLGHWKKSRPRG